MTACVVAREEKEKPLLLHSVKTSGYQTHIRTSELCTQQTQLEEPNQTFTFFALGGFFFSQFSSQTSKLRRTLGFNICYAAVRSRCKNAKQIRLRKDVALDFCYFCRQAEAGEALISVSSLRVRLKTLFFDIVRML